MPDRRDVEQLQTALNAISTEAQARLRWLFSSVDLQQPAAVRDALLDILPALVREHGDQAAAVAADWYESIRLRETGARGRSLRVTGGYPEDAVTRRVRSAMGHAFRGDPARSIEVLTTSLDKYVKKPARDTIIAATDRDGVMWARVPTGATTCGFCLMLASRGFAYTSEHAAKHRKADGREFHTECDCEPVMMFGPLPPEIEGYDPDGLYDEYLKARDFVGTTKVEAIAERMGEQAIRRLGTLAERQVALQAGTIKETLTAHEIVFYEQFKDAGERFRLIGRDREAFTSTNDFEWLSRGGIPVEVKSFGKPRYDRIADEIRRSVLAARAHDMVKDSFIVDLRGQALAAKLAAQLAKYNTRRPGASIRRLFVWAQDGLAEIEFDAT